MEEQNRSTDTNTNSKKYTSTSETERVFSVFQTFSKNAESIGSLSINNDEKVLTMSSIGKLGRFGNQLFQYAFLSICAKQSGARIECPTWIGQSLFGLQDTAITKCLPPAIEYIDNQVTLFDVIPEFTPYIEKLAQAKSIPVGVQSLNSGICNVDLWGFFQLHSKVFRPYQEYFRSLFQPVDDLKIPLNNGLNILRSKGKTIVGIHIRRGDYITEPRAGFTLTFPAKWYCQWLESIWDELEDPVLFLCSDDLDNVLPEFAKFSPVTIQNLEIKLPDFFKELDIDFYMDFFILSNCDVVCTSNSIFSFAACMLNERANMFVRPIWDFSIKFMIFDPWDSKPLLRLGDKQQRFFKNFPDILYTTYVTQGAWTMLKSLIVYIPLSIIKGWGIRLYLGYKVQGFVGVLKSVLYTFGWKSAWKPLDKNISGYVDK